MAVYSYTVSKLVTQAHTIGELIRIGLSNNNHTGYRDLSYYDTMDRIEFTIKPLIDDYLYELKQLAIDVNLTDKEVQKYRYNPKLLCYDVYGATKIYHVILRLNDMCNVHEFDLSNKKLRMLTVTDMSESLGSIYKAENFSLDTYNKNHENGKILNKEEKFSSNIVADYPTNILLW